MHIEMTGKVYCFIQDNRIAVPLVYIIVAAAEISLFFDLMYEIVESATPYSFAKALPSVPLSNFVKISIFCSIFNVFLVRHDACAILMCSVQYLITNWAAQCASFKPSQSDRTYSCMFTILRIFIRVSSIAENTNEMMCAHFITQLT